MGERDETADEGEEVKEVCAREQKDMLTSPSAPHWSTHTGP